MKNICEFYRIMPKILLFTSTNELHITLMFVFNAGAGFQHVENVTILQACFCGIHGYLRSNLCIDCNKSMS